MYARAAQSSGWPTRWATPEKFWRACNAGRWCPVGSNNTNEICRAGWQCPAGSVANSICQPGYFSGPGASSCTLCQPGSLANVFGATSCTICPAGTYSEPGSTSLVCSPCPQNTYSPNNGAGSRANCITCPLGYSAPPGSTACIAMQWTKMNPSYPLTGRLGGIAVANSTAVIAVGGRDANGVPSSVSLGYDSTTGQMVETFTGDANMTFDRAATAPHPTDGSAWVFGGVDASGLETASLWKLATNTGGRPTVSQVSFPASPAPANDTPGVRSPPHAPAPPRSRPRVFLLPGRLERSQRLELNLDRSQRLELNLD